MVQEIPVVDSMLYEIGNILIFGLPLLMWLGIFAFLSFTLALIVITLIYKFKYKIPLVWHMGLGAIGYLLAILHMILAMSRTLGF